MDFSRFREKKNQKHEKQPKKSLDLIYPGVFTHQAESFLTASQTERESKRIPKRDPKNRLDSRKPVSACIENNG